jgi:hypothetical protein
MHVKIAKRRAGGIASFPLSAKSALYLEFAAKTSFSILLICDPLLTLKCTAKIENYDKQTKKANVETLSGYNKKGNSKK